MRHMATQKDSQPLAHRRTQKKDRNRAQKDLHSAPGCNTSLDMDAALVRTQTGDKTMTADILSKIAAAAQADAVVFVDEMPGEQLKDSDDWDSAAFEMNKDLSAIDGAFAIYRKHLVAEIDRLNTIATYAATLTQVSPEHLRSIDLREESAAAECDVLRSSMKVGNDMIEILFSPEVNRAGVAAGSDAQWTDASSAADALRRYLNNDMST